MIKKVITFMMCACIAVSAGACTKDKIEEQSDVLKIDLLDAGYGIEFCYKLKEIFEESHPGKTVDIRESRTMQLTVENKMLAGPTRNDVDLFITSYSDFRALVDKGARAVSGYDCVVEDLTDIYESTDENGVKIKDKLDSEFTEYVTANGKYYAVPWASGPCGFMYNKTLFDYYGWKMPETVSELEDFCKQVNAEREAGRHSLYPIVYPGYAGSYWSYVYNTWACQYEGLDNYKAFWQGGLLKEDGTYDYANGWQVYKQQGRLESLKALKRILGNSSYIMPGSSTKSHTEAQADMLMGRAVIVPSGDWIEREMTGTDFYCQGIEGNHKTEIGYLQTPLLDVVAGWANYKDQTGIDEETGIEKSELYSRYLEAGKYAFSLGYQHLAIMPSYSNARDLAKDFLKLMVSDRGCDIFLQYGGSPSPFKQRYTDEEIEKLSLSEFRKAKAIFAQKAKYITKYETSPIRYKAGAANYMINIPEDVIPEGNISPEAIYNQEAENAQAMWSSWLVAAGLVSIRN